MGFIVAIDGPSGTGKGTVTSKIAKKYGLLYLDTGATYRCVTLKILRNNIELEDIEKIKEVLQDIKIEFKTLKKEEMDPERLKKEGKFEPNRVYLDGEDVTKEIREEAVTSKVSQVSHILEVRLAMVDLQRKMSKNKDVILEGRDIGTNVFPNADVKIYLDASTDERVKRRVKQNKQKGIEMSEEDVRKNIEMRDENDKNSDIGPLKQAEDAIYIDTTKLSIKQVVSKVSKIIKKKIKLDEKIEKAYIMTKETKVKKIKRKIVKIFLASLYRLVYRVKKVGIENLESDDGLLICANHVNYIDAVGIVVLNKKPIRFVGKADLWRIPIVSWLGHLFNIIPVKRDTSDMASIKMCLKSMKNKEILGIFPEGTRKGMERNIDVKNGAAFLAYKANVKVIPVGIKGTFKPFSKVIFTYGKPIDVTQFKTDDPNWLNDATNHIMKEIQKLSK